MTFIDKNGKRWFRVSKHIARKKFNKGSDIFFVPEKAKLSAVWNRGMIIPPKSNNDPKDKIFDQICDTFKRYGCDSKIKEKVVFYV